MALDDLIASKQSTALVEPPQLIGGLDALLTQKESNFKATEPRDFVSELLFSDKPIERWLPTEQAAVSGQIIDSMEKPMDWRTRLKNATLLSSMFGTNFNDTLALEPEMMQQIYGDELVNISEQFKKNPMQGGFFEKIAESWRRGDAGVAADIAAYEAVFEGRGDVKATLAAGRKIQLKEQLEPIEGELLAELFYKSANILPGMLRGYWSAIPEAATGMTAGALMAAAAGQLGPQVLAPEEIVIVPAGAIIGLKVGLATGSAMFWYKQGAGSMVSVMLDNDYDPEVSKNVAGIAAIPYAIIEFMQVKQLTPGIRSTIQKSVTDTMLKVMGRAAKKYAGTLTNEVLEEIAQEVIQIAAVDIAGILSDADINFDSKFIADRSARLWETAKESTKAMALLPIPGAAIDIRTGVKSVLSAQRQAEINAKLTRPPVSDFIIEPPEEVAEAVSPKEAVAEGAPVAKPPAKAAITPAKPSEGVQWGIRMKDGTLITGAFDEFTSHADLAVKKGIDLEQIESAGFVKDGEFNTQTKEVDRQERVGLIKGKAEKLAPKPSEAIEGEATFPVSAPTATEAKETFELAKSEFRDKLDEELKGLSDYGKFEGEIAPVGSLALEGDKIHELTMISTDSIVTTPGNARRDDDIKTFKQYIEEGSPMPPLWAEKKAGVIILEDGHQRLAAAKELGIEQVPVWIDAGETRRDIVQTAISEGKPVPPEVLAEYPDLAPTPTAEGEIITTQIQKKPFKPVAKKGPGLTKAEQELLTAEQQRQARFKQLEGEPVGFKAGLKEGRAAARKAVAKIQQAKKLTTENQETAKQLIKEFIDDKDLRNQFLAKIPKVKTEKNLAKLMEQVESGIQRAEKREVVKSLKKTIKGIKPKKMLPEFGKPAKNLISSFKVADIKPETQAKVEQLLEFARQVEASVDKDSVAWTKARHLIDIFVSIKAKTVNIQDLPIESLEQINEVLVSLKFQNDFETLQKEKGKAETIANEIETVKAEIQTKPSISNSPDATVSLGRAVGEKFITRHQNLESLTDKTTGGVSGLIGAERNSFTQFVYDTINEGVDVQYDHTLEARDLLRSIMDKHSVTGETIKTWLTDKHTFGDKTFTTNEMLSIYMHSRNNHNLTVMLNNGFNKFRTGVARIKKGKVLKLRGFDQTLIDDITSTLTSEQKSFAREVGKRLMDGLNRDAINETSLEAENLEIATVDNYWPAVRDTIRKILGKKVIGLQSLIEGMGILKERIGTGNPLLLRGFFETVYTSNKNVAAYKGLAIPLREVKAIFADKSLQDKLKKAGYEDELNVMMTQVERIENNSAETGDIEKAVSILIGGFAKSRFGINLKIAPRQQLSSTLIFAYVDPKYASEFKGLATKAILEEIFEISPQTQMRVESLRFDRDIGNNQLENDLMRYLTGKQNLTDIPLMGMKFFDTNAIADIYRATKAEVRDETSLDVKSDEFKTALKQRFEWVLRHTQPTWHPKDRSILGTSPNPLARALTMFMSQREKFVMMGANANQRYAKSKKTTDDLKEVSRTWGTIGGNMALFALFNFSWAVLVKKKAKSVRDFLAQMASDVTGLFFFGRYIGEIIRVANAKSQGKFAEASINTGPEQIVLQTIKSMTNYALAAEHFITGEKYQAGPNARELKWKTEIWVATEALYDAVAGVTGLPFSGPRDIVRSIKAHTVKEPRKRRTRKRKER